MYIKELLFVHNLNSSPEEPLGLLLPQACSVAPKAVRVNTHTSFNPLCDTTHRL